jgi:CRISPR/Cas system-associated exonuclease Cas4 (RecB family)
LGLEQFTQKKWKIVIDNQEKNIVLGGFADRIDFKEGVLRIIDYKTSGSVDSVAHKIDFDILFSKTDPKEEKQRSKNVFQALLYAWIIDNNSDFQTYPIQKISPAIFYISKFKQAEVYENPIKIEDFNSTMADFETHLKTSLENLLATNGFFSRRAFKENCKYCDYQEFCNFKK